MAEEALTHEADDLLVGSAAIGDAGRHAVIVSDDRAVPSIRALREIDDAAIGEDLICSSEKRSVSSSGSCLVADNVDRRRPSVFRIRETEIRMTSLQ